MYEDEERVARIVNEAVSNLQNKVNLEEIIRRVVGGLLQMTEEHLREEIRASQETVLAELGRLLGRPVENPESGGEETGAP